ncbi:MAG: hypothetical protein RRA94_05550 [Bacteroidota bacterium]|nr:hypothetical protein [Bacteroidota bacterium]
MKYFTVVVFLVAAAAAQAQQLAVESAKLDVVDAPVLGSGEMEVEFGYQFFYGEVDDHPLASVHSHSAGTAHLGITRGISDALDICLSVCWCEMQEHGAESHAGAGLGDAGIGVKWQFAEGTQHALALSAMLQSPLGLTYGGGGLVPGAEAWSVTPALIAGVSAGRLSTAVNFALVLPLDAPALPPMQMTSVAMGWQLTAALQPVVEAALAGGVWEKGTTTSISAGALLSLASGLRITAGLRHVLAGHGVAEQGGFFRMTSGI